MKAVIDELPYEWAARLRDGVMEDVEAVAVFSEEAQAFVLEDALGGGPGAQGHGDKRGEGDAD